MPIFLLHLNLSISLSIKYSDLLLLFINTRNINSSLKATCFVSRRDKRNLETPWEIHDVCTINVIS